MSFFLNAETARRSISGFPFPEQRNRHFTGRTVLPSAEKGMNIHMYKIYIIDDETPVRQWLRFCIEHSASRFEVVGDSANSRDGLAQLETVNADILFLDIMMPGLSGLDVLPVLRERFPQLSIVMLTNFSEFEYLQQAVRGGAEEYFLKSEITEETLFQCLENLIQKRESLLNQPSRQSPTTKEYNTVLQLSEQILNQTIQDKNQFQEKLLEYPALASFTSNLFVFAVKHEKSSLYRISNYAFTEISPYLSTLYTVKHTDHITLLVCEMEKIHSHLTLFNEITKMALWISSNLSFYTLGISNMYTHFTNFYEAVSEAIQAMHSGFYLQEGSIQYIYNTSNTCADKELLARYRSEIIDLVKSKAYEEIRYQMNRIFDYLESEKPVDIPFLLNYFKDLFYMIGSLYMSETQNYQLFTNNTNAELFQNILKCNFLSELKDLTNSLMDILNTKYQNPTYSPVINEAISYIQNHFTENITLKDVSLEVHMNADYLGKLLKKETGNSFNTYLTNLRMDYADYLIRNTSLKKYEIAEKLGYTNFSYFSRIYNQYKSGQKL